jgi:heptosyltransferase-2
LNSTPAIPASPSGRRILVRGVNWLGDAVMTTPALLRLRERFLDAHIALLTPAKLRDLWLHHRAVNETITFVPGESPLSVSRKLRAGDFEMAIVFPNSPRSALEAWLARIPRRIGYARPWRNFFLTTRVSSRPAAVKMTKRSTAEIRRIIHSPPAATRHPGPAVYPASAHQTNEYLHLVAAVGANPEPLPPYLTVTPEEINKAVHKFNLSAAGDRPVLAVNAGAEYGPAKRWPVERFIAATREIHKRTKCFWLILGGTGDLEVASRIEFELRTLDSELRNLAGQTSLRELCALLKRSRVLLTNDTGPMHLAAALGTPVVVPFGSTSPELTGPGLPGDPRFRLLKSEAPCSPCFRRECPIDFRCMEGIETGQVVGAVLEVVRK